ncbi:MAG: hypothetical protein CLLPBCKN_003035 [Chroococcidiopsis cubana SAG 39.79]|nr:hypothetical protein [Chroococcidiopsis cubana]MDZ4873639.1 hypothetical protein [Chroococcidiopsis cubana SAG 39.79]
MGYYDFDDQFWLPEAVCAKLPRQKAAQKLPRFWQFIEVLKNSLLERRN